MNIKKLTDKDLWDIIRIPKSYLSKRGLKLIPKIEEEFYKRDIKLKPIMGCEYK